MFTKIQSLIIFIPYGAGALNKFLWALAGRAQVTICMLHYLLSLLVTVSVNYIAISSDLHETIKKNCIHEY